MKRILFIITSMNGNGAERSLISLLNTIDKDKYNIDLMILIKEGVLLKEIPSGINILDNTRFITTMYGNLKEALKNNKFSIIAFLVRCFCVIYKKIVKTTLSPIQASWKISKRYVKKYQQHYDVSISYMDGMPLYYNIDKVDSDLKLAWNHNDYNRLGYNLDFDQKYYSFIDKIITISQKCSDILKSTFKGFDEKIVLIENIVSNVEINNKANDNIELHSEFKDYKGFKIISVGRLVEQKGFDIAINACEIMKNKGYKFRYYILGTGKQYDYLKELIKSKDLGNEVFLLGFCENPYPYIKGSDVVLQSSRFEGKSIVLDEAKILCKPIVATPYPTVIDQIIDGKEGYISVDFDCNSVCDTLIKMFNCDRTRFIDYLKHQKYSNESEILKLEKIIDA